MSTHYTFIPLLTRLLYIFPSLPFKRQHTIHALWTNELESPFRQKLPRVPAFILSRDKQISSPPFYRCGLQPPPRLQPTVCVTSLISSTICWLGARCRRSSALWQIQTASVERGLSQGLVQYGWVESRSVLACLKHPHLQGLWRKIMSAGVGPKTEICLEEDQI